MTQLMSVLPPTWRPYAKAWLSLFGAVLVSLSVVLPTVPTWCTVVASVLTALGVYAQPNAPLPHATTGPRSDAATTTVAGAATAPAA